MKKYTFFLFALLACLLAGCNETTVTDLTEPIPVPEKVEPDITIDSYIINNGLSFSCVAGDATVSFSTGGAWTLSIASTSSGNTWCRASETSGAKGKHSVKFTVDDNEGYDDRSVAVTIKSGGSSKTFTITQKFREALLVTTSKYELPKEGGKITLQVKSNVDYKLAVSNAAAEWITEEDGSGRALMEHKHVFRVLASEEADSRQGEIILSCGDLVETVTVYQAGEPAIVLSKNELVVDHAGDTLSVNIASNVEFGVQLPEVDWLTDLASSRGMSSHTLQYAVAPNDSYTDRTAQVIFFDKNCDISDTLTIRQSAYRLPVTECQQFVFDKDGMDGAVTKNGEYALLHTTSDNEFLLLAVGRTSDKKQNCAVFNGQGFLQTLIFDDDTFLYFLYTPDNICLFDSDNSLVAELSYDGLTDQVGEKQSRNLTHNYIYQVVDYVCNVIDKTLLFKGIKENIAQKVLESKLLLDVIREAVQLTGIPTNKFYDTIDDIIGVCMDTNKLGRICDLIDRINNACLFGLTSLESLPLQISDGNSVELRYEVLDLLEKSSVTWLENKLSDKVDYTVTLGTNVYNDSFTLSPLLNENKFITSDGVESFSVSVEEQYRTYYHEPYLILEGSIDIGIKQALEATVYIPNEYNLKLKFEEGTSKICFCRTMFGKRETFESESKKMREALVKLYKSTGGDNWGFRANWCSKYPMREWHGIGIKDNTITISLPDNNLRGEINQTFPDDLDIVLDVANNYLTSINLSESQTLNQFKCYGNSLNSLDVSGCVSLKSLQAQNNGIVTSLEMTLDASGCTSLTQLVLYSTRLTDVDISGCTSLMSFSRVDEPLVRLKARDCTSLVNIECRRTGLTELDLTGCTSLSVVDNIGNQLSALSISGCTKLKSMYFWKNESSSLKISNNASLKSLELNDSTGDITLDGLTGLANLKNGGTTLTLNNCSSLEYFGFGGQMTALTISNCKSLTKIMTRDDELQTLHVSGCPALDILDCSHCGLTDLQITGSPELKELSCAHNKLTSLDVLGLKSLEYLACNDNQLTSLAVSGMKKLKQLSASGNSFTMFDASGCESLVSLNLSYKGITSLNLSGCTSFKRLYWSNTYPYHEYLDLQTLDVSGCTALVELYLVDNKLTSLNVQGCTALKELNCGGNELTTLDVSGCIALKQLFCGSNKLTSLEAEGCMQIERIDCSKNQITREIPEWFARIKHASYDRRYIYKNKTEWGGPFTFTYQDNGVGWWFKGEPERGYHTWADTVMW